MDIHRPKHKLESLREFAVELFTVTCGIIIALSLEAGVTYWHERILAREARADFRAELAENEDKLAKFVAADAALEGWFDSMIDFAHARLAHQAAKPPGDPPPRTFLHLEQAAWDTALATQAIRLLGFQETRALAALYNRQAAVNALTVTAIDQWISVSGYDPDEAMSDEEGRQALKQLRAAKVYAQSLAHTDAEILAQSKAASALLGGRVDP
jgi:hypothetical protein